MITAFVLFLLVVIVLAVGLVSGVALLALRLTFLALSVVLRILTLPFSLFSGSRRDRLRRRYWRRGFGRGGAW